jgi:dsRNA-specific ribonuclease
MTLSSQGKLVKDAGSVACSARERPRTQIQRRHAGSGGKSKKHAEQEAAREAVDRLQEQT